MGYSHDKPKTEAHLTGPLNKKDVPFVKNLVSKLRKGSKTHAKQADDLEKAMKTEAMTFAVNVEGLPQMFLNGNSPGQIKANLRKMFKQPSMIQSVKRVTPHDVKKTFRLKAQGRDEKMNEELKVGSTVTPTKGPHAGHPHEVIHSHGDGNYNIKPKNMNPSRNKYRMGAVKANMKDLKV